MGAKGRGSYDGVESTGNTFFIRSTGGERKGRKGKRGGEEALEICGWRGLGRSGFTRPLNHLSCAVCRWKREKEVEGEEETDRQRDGDRDGQKEET